MGGLRGSAPSNGQVLRGICVAALLASMAVALPSPAQANCTTSGTTVTCDSSAPNPYTTTIGTGTSTAPGTTVNVGTNAQVVVGDANAISLGNNATITIAGGGLVQNTGVSSGGLSGAGPNTIELRNNGTLTVQAGATVYSAGSSSRAEAVNPLGRGNVIDNFGTIRADQAAAIFFEAGSSSNTVINEVGGVLQAGSQTTNAIASNGSAMNITNMGTIIGSLLFSGRGDTFNAVTGSSVTGTIDGGGGNDKLTLSGSGSGVMSSVLANWETVTKTDSGTWTLTANNTYSGTTSVNAGTLIVDGSIASSNLTTVNSGATLGGSGTVGATTINSGGTFAPGPIGSPGTMTVAGNLAFQSGAIYLVQVSPSSASIANVSGTATLAGTVQAAFASGSYLERAYTILTATGGLAGTFDGLSTIGLPAGFRTVLSYSGNTAILNLIAALEPGDAPGPAVPGTPAATLQTQNEASVGHALDKAFNSLPVNNSSTSSSSGSTSSSSGSTSSSSGSTSLNSSSTLPPNFLTIFELSGSNLTRALDQLDGEVATGAQHVAFQLMDQFLNLMLDPFVDGRNGIGGADRPALGFAPEREAMPPEIALAYAKVFKEPPAPIPVYEPRWTAWGGAYGGSNRTTGDTIISGSNNLSASTAGFAGGLDYHLTRDTLIGFALAGGGTNWSLAEALGSGKSDAFQAGVYGATRSGPAYVAAAFAFANHWMSTDRFAFAGDHLIASFNGQSLGGRLEGGYRFATMFGGLTPYAAIQAQSFHTPSYNEIDTNGGGFALSYSNRTAGDTRSELGGRFDRLLLASGDAVLAFRARAAWAHDWVSDPILSSVFQILPGSNFTVDGALPATNSALTSAGAELRLANGITMLAKFDGEFASHSTTYAGTGALRYRW